MAGVAGVLLIGNISAQFYCCCWHLGIWVAFFQEFQQRSCGQGVSVVVYLQMLFVVISAAVMHMLEWQDPVALQERSRWSRSPIGMPCGLCPVGSAS